MPAAGSIAYMAVDQHGAIYHIGHNAPRKWLLTHFDRKHAELMYRDSIRTGKSRHVGWVIARRWLEVFRVFPLHND